ncbi:MAG: hypothetical protein FWD23_10385 [Oscillospiraceae bacterium]|nr:hypothetical protein [Oscillospiraceae bacterium]
MGKKVDFFGTQITSMIIGDNPVSGHSYIHDIIPGADMKSYYTEEKIVELYFECERCGFDTILPLAMPEILKALKKYRSMGGKLNIIFQPYNPTPLEQNLDEMMELSPLATYHQGTVADMLIENGDMDTLHKNIELIKKTGMPTGLATHVPQHALRSEEENWGVDFYMTCLYNLRRGRRGEPSGFVTGKTKIDIEFYPEDRFEMFAAIQKIQKPCIAYKFLAGGNIFREQPQEKYEEIFERYTKETYENIKPGDMTCIGVFQRDFNQLAMDARAFEKAVGK